MFVLFYCFKVYIGDILERKGFYLQEMFNERGLHMKEKKKKLKVLLFGHSLLHVNTEH